MLWSISVLPAFGGDTIKPLWPLPIGAIKSIILDERSSLEPLPCSSTNLSLGNKGVRFSKRILFLVFLGSSPLIVSTWIRAKYLSLSLGVLILPATESPFLKPNFLIWLGDT